ncbi:MAG: hemoglobin [bacterium]|nr:MAG: hemoglobin [bacterium]
MSSDPEARRQSVVRRIEAETGIDEPMIARLVDAFYDRVRADPLLGPVFIDRVSDWGPHLQQMRLFWSSVALNSGAYHGRPMPKHLPLELGIAGAHGVLLGKGERYLRPTEAWSPPA